jgi:hypothetical protein
MRNKKSIWSGLLKETLPSPRKETLKASPCNVLHNHEKHFFFKKHSKKPKYKQKFLALIMLGWRCCYIARVIEY